MAQRPATAPADSCARAAPAGRYLAELTKELLADLEETKYSLSEYRLSIYGRGPKEWKKLAAWVMGHGLVSLAGGESVVKCPSPLNALKDTYNHRFY